MGIQPDVSVLANQALDVALKLAAGQGFGEANHIVPWAPMPLPSDL